jgi:mRNA degradation ribonuclease J1/J2
VPSKPIQSVLYRVVRQASSDCQLFLWQIRVSFYHADKSVSVAVAILIVADDSEIALFVDIDRVKAAPALL